MPGGLGTVSRWSRWVSGEREVGESGSQRLSTGRFGSRSGEKTNRPLIGVEQGVRTARPRNNGPPGARAVRSSAGTGNRPLQLPLGHLRPALDPQPLRVVVELVARAATRAVARLLAAAAARRPAAGRDARRL